MSTLSSEYRQPLETFRVLTDCVYRLNPAMAMKHGFSSVAEYKANAQKKFSLLETGIIQRPSTRLLLIIVGCFLGLAGGFGFADLNRAPSTA
jgi:hypothetical protein